VLLLGLDAPLERLADQLAAAAAQPLCRGFAVGRTIFGEAARAWFEQRIDDAATVAAIAERYALLLQRFASAATGQGSVMTGEPRSPVDWGNDISVRRTA
jgi:5-dehydro-2-deoxygluconokinase